MNEPRILSGLPVFRAVARLGGFSTAATRLGVTPSAVSQAIRALEDQLGVLLIARTSRSMRLTAAGSQLLSDIDGPLAQLAEAVQSLRHQEQVIEGALRIALSPRAGSCITPYLAGFLAAYPGIRLDLTCDDAPGDLVKGNLDAAIGFQRAPDGDVISVPVGPPVRWAVMAGPAYLALHGTPLSPEDLMVHRLCRRHIPGSARLQPLRFQRGAERVELDPPAAIVLDDPHVTDAVLRTGQVMAQVPLHGPLDNTDLIEVLADFAPEPLQCRIYYPSRVAQTAWLRAFLDWCAHDREATHALVNDAVFDQLSPLDRDEVIV